ncbi:helix-turn-helix domain-containing protein [Streptomyces longwoodensis]|uniref:helix-turn-helix domain-containing protein n=1 Tax=Streptomyces longwoodensis TaxID=68231 RepID=UPI003850A989
MVKPRQRLTGDLATAFSAYVVALYTGPDGMSISAICEKTARSYGNIHRILTAAKITMRNRGGDQRPSRAAEPRKEHHEDDVVVRGASADTRLPVDDSAEVGGAAGRST